MFLLKTYMLPHDGVIPGARGHRKVIVPAGTKVWCITYGTLIFWCAYLDEESARSCMLGLIATIQGRTKRTISLESLLAWNFKRQIPIRISRPKGV